MRCVLWGISLILGFPRFLSIKPDSVSTLLQTEPFATPRLQARPSAVSWRQVAVLAAFSLWLYAPTLYHLFLNWKNDPNYSHGFFVPLFSAWMIWQERSRLATLPLRPAYSGLAVIAFALALLIVGQMGAELFLARFSLLILLAGLIVLFFGWNYLQALSFPLAFLVLMIPLPALIFNQITFPLQLLASRVAAAILWPLLGVPVLRDGNILHLAAMPLEVADACSGIRSLISLTTLAIIYGYLMERRIGMRIVLAIAAVPIAVMANSLRIVGTGVLVQYWAPDKAEGFFHEFSGWLIFVVSLLMLYALHQLLRAIWKEPETAVSR
jgi:exosortase